MFRTGEGLFDMTLLDRINDDSFMANLKERFQVRREIFYIIFLVLFPFPVAPLLAGVKGAWWLEGGTSEAALPCSGICLLDMVPRRTAVVPMNLRSGRSA